VARLARLLVLDLSVSKASFIVALPAAAVVSALLSGAVPPGKDARRGDPATGARAGRASTAIEQPAYTITPVTGPSRIHQLGLELDRTSLGRVGRFGPSADARPLQGTEAGASFVLTGADLYRLNCRSCHESDGQGVPPEIHSVIPPVRGASPAWLKQDFKRRGFPVNDQFLAGVAKGAQQDLRKRLAKGGQEMPAFGHLQGPEVDALVGYLQTLAAVPDAPAAPTRVREDLLRVGEHIVKGTCHTCHDATGPDVDAEAMARGEIPPLASFPRKYSVDDVVGKVREGRRITGGLTAMSDHGRMPVFSYLTPSEVASAYFYLSLYPPRQ